MRRKCALILLVLFCTGNLYAQLTLTGKVINAETKQPLLGAAVYISNTSLGSHTNDKGNFRLPGIPNGKYKLVASFIGYQTFTIQISSNHLPEDIVIELKPESAELSAVVLQSYEKNGWLQWGEFFTNNFIGTYSYAKDCIVDNYNVVKFRFDKKENILYAHAREPLIIKNLALGYKITYKMEAFEYDFNTKTLTYNGYPLFQDLSSEYPGRARRWREKREVVYNGSLMHFMRSFFANKLADEGFEIKSLDTIPNATKARAKYLFGLKKDTVIERIIDTIWKLTGQEFRRHLKTEDSTAFYKKSLLQPDRIPSYAPVTRDSIGIATDSLTVSLYAGSPLEISALFKDLPLEYKRAFPSHRFEKIPVSQFIFIAKKPVSVLSNGAYYGPYDLKVTGFWSWWETIATMLPFDYVPPKKDE